LADPHRTGKSPAFQFYPSDFLNSPKVRRMSLTERGAYISLLSLCWLDGSLSNSVAELARELHVAEKQFARMWDGPLSECFYEKGGRLHNERLDRERKKQALWSKQQKDRADKGWAKRKLQSVGNAAALQAPQCSTSSSSFSSSSSSAEKRETPPPRPAPIVQRRRGNAAFEGARGLYVVESQHQQFVGLRNHPGAERELLAWYAGVCEDWAFGSHASSTPNPDMFKFWQERFVERWPPTAAAKVDDKIPEWLRKARASQAAAS
jgi:uncharacterized protein YdaU (DUF1376 family)